MDVFVNDFEENVDGKPIWEGERCEPLGAAKENLEDEKVSSEFDKVDDEHEIPSSTFFALTSHLAQVQFRLRQIVLAPTDDKEVMLKELEEFTYRGFPDQRHVINQGDGEENTSTCSECSKLDEKMKQQRTKQIQFINQLKTQLRELERFSMVTSKVGIKDCQETRKLMMKNVKEEIAQTLKDNWRHSTEGDELGHQINCAVRQFVAKHKGKGESVEEDMQEFIRFLQKESLMAKAPKHNVKASAPAPVPNKPKIPSSSQYKSKTNDDLRAETINLMRKMVTLLQMFTVSQFGCSPRNFRKNDLKNTNINHWGDLRARLEMSVDAVLSLVSRSAPESYSGVESYDSDSEDNAIVLNNVPLTIAVRKHLAINIKDLMQHGLLDPGDSSTVVPFIGCFPMRRSSSSKQMHIWDLILKYYEINNGECFNSTPARKLSQSFNLDIVGGTAISNKQSMLGAIGSIIASHGPYKKSSDAHFKAFICAALNVNKLVPWLNLLYKNKSLVHLYYSPTSYVVNTGFQDCLQSLDKLTPYKFDLPVDLAIKQFQNIKDVFM